MKKCLQIARTILQCRLRQISIHSIFLLLSLIFFLLSSSALAEIRYVSKTGSSTPPYTSWETASDSIQKCIDISQFGDTIYVANGVYKEQVVMIPGLSLIGAGMDSCVIDTREFDPLPLWSITMDDSCSIESFQVIVSDEQDGGGIITGTASKYGKVEFMSIRNTSVSLLIDASTVLIQNNIFLNTEQAIYVFGLLGFSNPKIYSNIFLLNTVLKYL